MSRFGGYVHRSARYDPKTAPNRPGSNRSTLRDVDHSSLILSITSNRLMRPITTRSLGISPFHLIVTLANKPSILISQTERQNILEKF